jgi:hypothetical protein
MLSRIDILTATKRTAESLVDALAVEIFWAALGDRRRFALRLFNAPNIGPDSQKDGHRHSSVMIDN